MLGSLDLLMWSQTLLRHQTSVSTHYSCTFLLVSHTHTHAFPGRVQLRKRKQAGPTSLWQSSDKGCQIFRLIKISASLCSLITPHKDPWVASMSTLRLKWMFTSPNDYLSQSWVNATASVPFATRWGYTHTDTRPQSEVLLPVCPHETFC